MRRMVSVLMLAHRRAIAQEARKDRAALMSLATKPSPGLRAVTEAQSVVVILALVTKCDPFW
jgi:hypothetical protein